MLTGPRRQLHLLGRAPSFRALFLATTASGLGTWLSVIALTVDVYDRTHSAKWVSALLVADFLPAVVIGLGFGPIVDRFSRWRLMVGSDVVSAAVFVALIFAGSSGQIVGLAAVAGFAAGFFRPASYAGLPNLVAEDDLASANSLLRSSGYLTTVVGTLLGGIVTGSAGPHVAYGVNAASFAASAVLLGTIPASKLRAGERPAEDAVGYWSDVRAGFSLVLRSQPLLAVFISWNLVMLATAGVNVAEIFLARNTFHSGSFGFGLLWAGSGVGLVLGSFYASSWLEHRSTAFVYGVGLALMAFGHLATALSPDVWVAAVCQAVAGVGNGVAVVCNSLLVQRGAPDHLRGRAFTTIMSANYALLGAGMALAGPVTDALGGRWVFGAAAGFEIVAALVGQALTRHVGLRGAEPAATPG